MSLNYENCSAAAAAFTTKRDFKAKSNPEYQWLVRNGLLDNACAHITPLHRALTDDNVASIAKQYTNRRAFKLGYQSAYQAARKRGILDHVCSHMSLVRRILTSKQIFEIASRFASRSEFVEKDRGAYQTATKRGILDEVCEHMDSRGCRRLSDSEILQIAIKFKTRNDLKLGDFGAYTTAIRRGLIESCCAHMEFGATGFRPDMPAVLYQFRVELECGLVIYKVGITNRKPRQRMMTMGIRRGVKAELTNFIQFEFGRDARIAEKRLHMKFAANRYDGLPVMKNGNTELFTINVLDH